MYCPECGRETPSDKSFCINCGAEVKGLAPSKLEESEEEGLFGDIDPSSLVDSFFTPFEEKFPESRLLIEEPSSFSPFSEAEVINNRYEVRGVLGRGGMGVVYKVYDRILKEDIALKVLLRSLMRSEKAVEMFYNEAKISLSLTHQNIVRVRDIGETDEVKFISMELLDGINLRDWMALPRSRSNKTAVEDVTTIIKQVCNALSYAHRFTVHRDIKPENIMVLKNLQIKITDFGISKLLPPIELSSTVLSVGTAYYMAPEQYIQGSEVDHRADIYSVGVLLYELLVGKLPIGRFKIPSQLRSDLPSIADHIITKSLESEPEDRYENIEEMKSDILILEDQIKKKEKVLSKAPVQKFPAKAEKIDLNKDFFFHFNLGLRFQKQRKYRLAIEQYHRAIEIQPKFVQAYNNLGSVYFLSGSYPEAMEEYKKAIELKPDYAEAYYNLAMVCEAMRDINQAIDCYRMVIGIRPDHERAHQGLGGAYKTLREYNKAAKKYRRALSINAHDPITHNLLGNVYILNGKVEEAIREYREALRLKPDYKYALKNLEKAMQIEKENKTSSDTVK
ncbi:hypothetical protein CEE39_07355 [bacterium (candidate division B38) B3_B38]|nr:MAG: hypothetical protein CEE39_07355 [bacterium (candidate division B38) B3_B38]